MPSLPPEIKSLIAAEVWYPFSTTPSANLSLAWPEMAPFVRECRFKDINIRRLSKMRQLMDILDSVQGSAVAIWRIRVQIPHPTYDKPMAFLLLPLVSRAVNLKELSLEDFVWKDYDGLSPLNIIGACPRLTMLSLCAVSFPRLSDLVDILHSIPNLTTLNVRCLQIDDLKDIALGMWPRTDIHTLESCTPPWDPRGFEAPKPVSQLSCLEIHILRRSDLMLLDLLSSPKTPFPNLQEITLILTTFCAPRQPFSELFRRYPSLRLFYIQSDDHSVFFVLPATVEHFQFALNCGSEDQMCETLASRKGNLKNVTVYMNTHGEKLTHAGRLDEVMAGMNLERINLESRYMEAEEMESLFPLCRKLGTIKASLVFRFRLSWFLADRYSM